MCVIVLIDLLNERMKWWSFYLAYVQYSFVGETKNSTQRWYHAAIIFRGKEKVSIAFIDLTLLEKMFSFANWGREEIFCGILCLERVSVFPAIVLGISSTSEKFEIFNTSNKSENSKSSFIIRRYRWYRNTKYRYRYCECCKNQTHENKSFVIRLYIYIYIYIFSLSPIYRFACDCSAFLILFLFYSLHVIVISMWRLGVDFPESLVIGFSSSLAWISIAK